MNAAVGRVQPTRDVDDGHVRACTACSCAQIRSADAAGIPGQPEVCWHHAERDVLHTGPGFHGSTDQLCLQHDRHHGAPPSPTAMAAAHSPHANTCPSCVSRLNGMNGLGLGAGQVWGGGLALRGPDGSMVNVCDGMVAERKQVHPDPSSSRVSAAGAPSPPHSTTPRALPLAAVGVLCLAPARAVAFRAGATQRAPRGGAQVFVSFAIGLVAFLWVVSLTRGHCIAP